ncbi:MAG: hypothetical protein E7198_08505 [Schwartzia succinivorans]|uniref:hypothetical protein n=1 Tax=Schwartzia succinivorans TaxID=55507 RepID=UPI0023529F3E|nr:hypothetical protein [Schwartzia succinivorans]MBE6097821.1 hypothetical protein [Schwartzia succinivorans]
MERRSNIWKGILVTASLCIFCCTVFMNYFAQTAEARASVRVADREMKKSRDYQGGGAIYERARRIIYGMNPPSGPEGRVRIAIVINGDENIIVKNRVKDEIYTQLRKKFPREEFAVMKGTDVTTKLLQYAEDKFYDERGSATVSSSADGSTKAERADSGIISGTIHGVTDFLFGASGTPRGGHNTSISKSDRLDADGVPVRIQPRGMADLRREDYVRAGRECDYDYVFVATLTNGAAVDTKHNFVLFNNVTNHKNVWLRLRFVDTASGNYLYRNDIVVQGETHNGTRDSGRILQRAIHEAMKEALDDISVDY